MNKNIILILVFIFSNVFAVDPHIIPNQAPQIDRVVQQEQQRATARNKEFPTDVFFGRPAKTDLAKTETNGKNDLNRLK